MGLLALIVALHCGSVESLALYEDNQAFHDAVWRDEGYHIIDHFRAHLHSSNLQQFLL